MSTATESQRLHLAFATDEAYVPHGATMLASFFHHHAGVPVTVHLVCDAELGSASRDALQKLVEARGAQWVEHEVKKDVVDRLPPHPRYPKSAWFRVLFAELIPVPRLLYLDCDLVVSGSLLPLWNLDLEDQVLAAAIDGMWPYSLDYFHRFIFELGLERADEYFNTGVMVIDLERLRREGWSEKLMDFVVHQRGPMPCADQDAMNAVLRGRWLRLDSRWNLMPPLLLSWQQGVDTLPRGEILRALLFPRVIHFFGDAKPWKQERRHPLRSEYWFYRRRTPWASSPPYALGRFERALEQLPSRWRLACKGVVQTACLTGVGLEQLGVAIEKFWYRYRHRLTPRYAGGWLLNSLPWQAGGSVRRLLRAAGIRQTADRGGTGRPPPGGAP